METRDDPGEVPAPDEGARLTGELTLPFRAESFSAAGGAQGQLVDHYLGSLSNDDELDDWGVDAVEVPQHIVADQRWIVISGWTDGGHRALPVRWIAIEGAALYYLVAVGAQHGRSGQNMSAIGLRTCPWNDGPFGSFDTTDRSAACRDHTAAVRAAFPIDDDARSHAHARVLAAIVEEGMVGQPIEDASAVQGELRWYPDGDPPELAAPARRNQDEATVLTGCIFAPSTFSAPIYRYELGVTPSSFVLRVDQLGERVIRIE